MNIFWLKKNFFLTLLDYNTVTPKSYCNLSIIILGNFRRSKYPRERFETFFAYFAKSKVYFSKFNFYFMRGMSDSKWCPEKLSNQAWKLTIFNCGFSLNMNSAIKMTFGPKLEFSINQYFSIFPENFRFLKYKI